MRTLLINLPYPISEWPTLPLGLTYLAAVLAEKGHEVEILDMLITKFSIPKVKEKIQEFKPDICGAGPVTMNYPTALRVIEVCKKLGATTIMGGCHVTFYDRKALEEAPYLDTVVRGEGEHTLLDIVEGKDLCDIDGVTYREDGEIIRNPDRNLIEKLDELPFPARHLVPISKYRAFKSGCDMITGRGCPYNCTFCVGHKMVGRKPRFRDIKLCVDEIEKIVYDYGFKKVNIVDDLLTINHKRVFAFCDEFLDRGIKVGWTAFSRVDTVTKELLGQNEGSGMLLHLLWCGERKPENTGSSKEEDNSRKNKEGYSFN